MTIRRFRPFSWDRVVIYGGSALACAGLCARAVAYNRADLSLGQWIAMLAATAGFVAGAAMMFASRVWYAREITFYTAQGVRVVMKHAAAWATDDRRRAIERTIADAMAFWISQYPHRASAIVDFFNGATLTFTQDLLVYHARGPDGQRVKRLANGLTSYNWMGVRWDLEANFSHALSLVKHEASHVALNAVGVASGEFGELHHAAFRERGFHG